MIPTIPGVPSWGAVLIAVTFTAIGFAFDAGSGGKELTLAFAVAYVIGCIAAVVAVRHTGIFTAVIQPPLILFVCVPGAYFLFHGGTMDGIKDLLINCGYPLIERFPLMFFTTAMVLLVGLVRWYMGMSRRRSAPVETAESDSPFSAVTSKISGLLKGEPATEDAVDDAPASRRSRQHSIDRSARTAKPKTTAAAARTRSGRPAKRTQPSRSRHSPSAGDRDHRTRGRASASAAPRPPNDRPDGPPGRAATSSPVVVDTRTPQATTAAERAPIPVSAARSAQPVRRLRAVRAPRNEQDDQRIEWIQRNERIAQRQPPPDLAGAVSRRRRWRSASGVSGPATGFQAQASCRCLGVRRLNALSAGPHGSRAATRRPAFRWPW